MGVTSRGFHFKDTIFNRQKRHIECTATQVKNQNIGFTCATFLVQTVRNSSGGLEEVCLEEHEHWASEGVNTSPSSQFSFFCTVWLCEGCASWAAAAKSSGSFSVRRRAAELGDNNGGADPRLRV
eukprot:Selendium_serpulae@DN7240_c0_g1_i1.p2